MFEFQIFSAKVSASEGRSKEGQGMHRSAKVLSFPKSLTCFLARQIKGFKQKLYIEFNEGDLFCQFLVSDLRQLMFSQQRRRVEH